MSLKDNDPVHHRVVSFCADAYIAPLAIQWFYAPLTPSRFLAASRTGSFRRIAHRLSGDDRGCAACNG
jgi:hypothetical protein